MTCLAECKPGDREAQGALLRREGLYSSLISAWREQRDKGALKTLGRSAGAQPPSRREKGATLLRRQNEVLSEENGHGQACHRDPGTRQVR